MDKQKARYRVVVQYLETGDAFIELPNDLLKQVDWGGRRRTGMESAGKWFI